MDVMLQNQDVVDPLHNYPYLSLLRRTFEGLSGRENPTLDNLQLALEALEVKSSSNLCEQAKTIVDSSSELLRTDFSQVMESTCEDRATLPKVNVRPQERRPALGRKRARFSLKPATRQPDLCGGMSLNTDKLQDPEEFFMAVEKIERAEKELRKQRGDLSTDSTQHMLTNKERIRRPGILGRKSDYRQRFSLIAADLDETLGSSKKLSDAGILSPSNSILNVGTTDERGASQEKQLVGDRDLIAEEKSKEDGLIEELLSEDYTKLDGNGTLEYLQERFQIKPTKLDKLCMPDVDSVRKRDANVSLEQLPRQIKKSSDIHAILKKVRNKESAETPQLAVSSSYSLDSPTPSRSPFSSVSILSKHLDGDRPGNQSLFPGIDDISPKDLTHVEGIVKGAPSHPVNANSESAEMNDNEASFCEKFVSNITENDNEVSFCEKFVSMITEHDPSENNINESFTKDSTRSFDPVDENSTHKSGLDDMVEGMQQLEAVGKEKNPLGSEKVSDYLVAGDVEDKIEDGKSPKAVDSGENIVDSSMENIKDDNPKEVDREENLVDSSTMLESVHPSESQLDVQGHAVAEHSENTVVSSVQNNQGESGRESPGEPVGKRKGDLHTGRKRQARKNLAGKPLNVGSNQRALCPKEMRGISRRKSLLGAGTRWEGGVRKSTRNREKPVEFWRGEQLIYELVHENLLTVVGRKPVSPAKGMEHR